MDIKEVSQKLYVLSEEIAIKNGELYNAQTDYLVLKVAYENEYASQLLQSKATGPELTQSELKAWAIKKSHETRMKYVMAESKYKKLQNELRSLRDQLEALKEISYNLRKEMSL